MAVINGQKVPQSGGLSKVNVGRVDIGWEMSSWVLVTVSNY